MYNTHSIEQNTFNNISANTELMPIKQEGTWLVSASSFEHYVQKINRIPLLTPEVEQELAKQWFGEQDTAAAQKLVLGNLRFVVHVARGYLGYGLPLADLVQEGNIGLMKAVHRFDPRVGVRLISFAVHWIKSEIHEYIVRNWRVVRIATTKSQRKLFFNLRSSKKRLGWMHQDEVQAIADDLGVTPNDVLEMEQRLGAKDVSFDAPLDDDSEDNFHPVAYLAAGKNYDPAHQVIEAEWEEVQQTKLQAALETLDERSRVILARRWLSEEGQKAGLQELGHEYGVSAERIRQIESAALKKLKKFLGN